MQASGDDAVDGDRDLGNNCLIRIWEILDDWEMWRDQGQTLIPQTKHFKASKAFLSSDDRTFNLKAIDGLWSMDL